MEEKMKELETNVNQEEKEVKKMGKKSKFIIGAGLISAAVAGGAYIIKKLADKKQVGEGESEDDYEDDIEIIDLEAEDDSDETEN